MGGGCFFRGERREEKGRVRGGRESGWVRDGVENKFSEQRDAFRWFRFETNRSACVRATLPIEMQGRFCILT